MDVVKLSIMIILRNIMMKNAKKLFQKKIFGLKEKIGKSQKEKRRTLTNNEE